jgi:hypothetical protein
MIVGLARRGPLNAVIDRVRRRRRRCHIARLGILPRRERHGSSRLRLVLVPTSRNHVQSKTERQVFFHFAFLRLLIAANHA